MLFLGVACFDYTPADPNSILIGKALFYSTLQLQGPKLHGPKLHVGPGFALAQWPP